MSTNQPDSATIPQDNVTFTPPVAVPAVTKTPPECVKKTRCGRNRNTVRNSVSKRTESSRKLKKLHTKPKTSPPINMSTHHEQDSVTVVKDNVTWTSTAIAAGTRTTHMECSKKKRSRSRNTVRRSISKRVAESTNGRKRVSDSTNPSSNIQFTEADMQRSWNREEEDRIISDMDAKYSMDNFFSEEEVAAGCKWDYSVLLSELPSEEEEGNKDKDSNNNNKTNMK